MKKTSLGIVFLTLLIDLIGFSIAFPLFPAMLAYYLAPNGQEDPLLAGLINTLRSLSPEGGERADFLASVLFGGLLASIYSILQFIFAPIWGSLSDRFGRRPMLLLTLTGTAVGYAVWVFSGNFLLLITSRLITGAMGGNLSVATAAIADLTTAKDRAKGMALVGVAFGLGFILGPGIGGLTANVSILNIFPDGSAWGLNPFSIPAMIALGLALTNLVWVLTRFEETLAEAHRFSAAARRSSISPWARIKSLVSLENAAVRQTCWVNFVYILAFSGLEFSLTFLAAERLGFGPGQNGGMLVYVGLLMVLTQGILIRRLSPIWGEKPLTLLGLTSAITAFIALAFAHNTAPFFVSLGLVALGAGFMNCLMALASLYSSSERQGQDLGVFRSAGSLARALGPLLGAWVYFCFGSQTAYLIGALVLAVPLLIALPLPKPAHAQAP